MTLCAWLRRLWHGNARPTQAPPEPFDEATRRLELAIERTEDETRLLVLDGSELAERIRRNARTGRGAFQGKPT